MRYSTEETGKRIKAERERRKLSQKKLGDTIGVSGKQISNYEKGILFPPLDILTKLCGVFDCELGYLLGEEDYSEGSKFLTEVQKRLGLDTNSMKMIMYITGSSSNCYHLGIESEENRIILNKFLSAEKYREFFRCLADMEDAYVLSTDTGIDLEKKYSKEQITEALKVMNSEFDYTMGPNALNPDDEICKIINDIEDDIDRERELQEHREYKMKVARYELNKAFERLIDSIYPIGD